jgi:nucleoside-diphosphate-sugar epimerase
VTKAMNQSDEYDAVVSTIGGTPADPRADSEANIALIDAAAAKGVGKFVLVTSIGVGDSADAPPPNVFDALKPVLVEKAKAEEHLKAVSAKTGMPYVIVRPGGLKSEPATGHRRCSRRMSAFAAPFTAKTSRIWSFDAS